MSKTTRRLRDQNRGRFVGIPYTVASSKPFVDLRAPEVKLLFDLAYQYNGSNNGCLSACHSLMKDRGWAKSSLHRAFNNLQHAGFVVVTRQGAKIRGMATLVAITWIPIDEPRKDVEYDGGISPSNKPLSYWCKSKASWKFKPRTKPPQKSNSSNMEDKQSFSYPNLELVQGGKS